MSITATELKNNMRKYLVMAALQDIYITIGGKVAAKLSSPQQDKIEIVNSLIGILPDTVSLERAREERLSKI